MTALRLALLAALAPLATQAQPAATAHPAQMMEYASQAFAAGQREDGVFWFYLGQLRWRARLAANPGLDPSGEPAAFSALFETLGPQINEWAFGDVPALAATINRVLAFDAANPDPSIASDAMAESRAGLSGLRDQILAEAASIRAQREAAGLGNR